MAAPPLLLSRAAYLAAIDVSVARIRGDARRVWIDGPGAVWLTAAELRARRIKRGDGFRKCPGEPTVTLGVPSARPPDRVDLPVVESNLHRPLSKTITFACANGECRMLTVVVSNGSSLLLCGPGMPFMWQPPRHPLTNSAL